MKIIKNNFKYNIRLNIYLYNYKKYNKPSH